MAHPTHNLPIDSLLEMKAASAVTTTTTHSSHDLGAAKYQRAALVVDITACDATTGDELCVLQLQGATASGFSTAYQLATLRCGDLTQTGDAIDTQVGRYVLHFDNVVNVGSGETINVQHLRLRTVASGTSPSVTYQAWLSISDA